MTSSAVPSEGKTSTATNIAVVSAQAGKRVLIIDGDMRKPQVHQRFSVSNLNGLSNLLIKERTIEECVVQHDTAGLFLLPSGPIPPNPSEMLGSKSFSELIQQLREEFDLIILDTPPVLTVTDGLVATKVVDGVVFVLDSSKTNRALVKKSIVALEQVGANILGIVLNRVKLNRRESAYYYNYYAEDRVR